MSAAGRTLLPWAHRSGAYALPTSILVRLKLGETPDTIPTALDVRSKASAPADRTGHNALDRVVRTFGSIVRVSRLHAAAAALRSAGAKHRGYSDAEQVSGVARVLRFDVAPGTHIGSLAISLQQLEIVESAIPNYLCAVGLDRDLERAPAPVLTPDVEDDGWAPRDQINAREAMAREPGDRAVIIGVVDTGLDLDHVEFNDRTRRGFDTVQLGKGDLANGISLLGDNAGADTNPSDRYVGHGSGCAGIIAGLGRGMPPGVAGECPILPIRSLGAAQFPARTNAVGLGAISDLDMGVVIAVQLGARVLNLSFGTDDDDLEPGAVKPHTEAVAYATERGVTLVAASGNSGDARTYWPASFPDVIAVGAVAADGSVCDFSTTGGQVALCAPGERVRTAGLQGYQCATGTSFAAPFVAATAALLHSRADRRAAPLAPAQVKQLLIASARPHRPGIGEGSGAGVLDAARALELLDAALDADATTELEKEDDR
jgi:subtilisin family serine protease